MTQKELRRLSRVELLDILYEQQRQLEQNQAETERLRQALNDRQLKITEAGSIAEAAVRVSGVFEAAQAAADQYLASVKAASAGMAEQTDRTQQQCEAQLRAAEEKADEIIRSAQEEADRLLAGAQEQITARWEEFRKNADALIQAHDELRMLIQKD